MALLWGREGILVYNDAYRVILGDEHPQALGRPARELGPEVSPVDAATLAIVLERGETVCPQDAPFPRDPRARGEAHFSVCCSPVRVESGAVGGALVTLGRADAELLGEARARAIARNIRDSLIVLEAVRGEGGAVVDWRYLEANDGALELLGKARGDVVGRTVREVLPGRGAVTDRLARVLASGEAERYETEYRDSALLMTVFRLDPSTVGVAAVDITERKRHEEALRENERRLRGALDRLRIHMETTPLALVEWDSEFRVIGYSPRAEALFGWPAAEVLGRRIDEIPWVREEDWPSVRAVMRDMASGVRPANVNANRNVRRDGSTIYCEWYNSTVHDAAGKLVSVLSLVLDVTDRERAIQALRTEERKYRGLFENSLDAVYLTRPDGTILDANQAACRMHEMTLEEIKERGRRGLVVNDERHAAALRTRAERGQVRAEMVDLRKDGSRFPVEVESVVVDPSTAFVIARDITDRKRAEQGLREANERLREVDRRKDEFLGMLSHELRNPLAPIRNALYILDRAEPTSEQARRAREVANRQLVHITRLVDDLLDVTRIARGKIELRREDLDLAALARRTAEDYRALLEDRGLALELALPGEPVAVSGDETRLAQVLGNLLSNAAKFTPAGGRVSLRLGVEEGRAVVRVRDTGVGIAPEVLPTLFEPFTQAKQTLARSEGGLGLGLALVKGLVALHGGEVAATSGAGGTEFVVRLPLANRPGSRWSESPAPA
jgi:PAS domain S-box-containing protein